MKNLKLITIFLILTLISCTKTTNQHKDLEDGMYATITTKYGDILLQLEFEKTPMTVANFVSLAEGTNSYVTAKYKGKPFYDGLKFHRVLKDFMIQGGDPLGTGAGDPGYKFKDEFDPSLVLDKAGILAMANSGPGTNGSQFFITHKATTWLNNKHTVFGHVIKGQDIVDVVAQKDIIEKITIIRNGEKAKAFNAKKVFNTAFGTMEEEAKIAAEKRADAMKNILEKEKKATKYSSGLKIYVENKGTGKQPKKGDRVKMNYTGYFTNGDVLDTSIGKRPFVTKIGVGQVIQGWDEGVVKMKEGEKAIFYIPSHLAWGEQGAGKKIKPNTDFIFEVELLEVLK